MKSQKFFTQIKHSYKHIDNVLMFKNSDMAAVKLGLDKIYKNLTQELTYESYKVALIGNLVKNSSNQYTWNKNNSLF
ncbi:hypothetical protein [Frischella perrara]|uniref:hypothetical protein n=1 Tax=Frischella perrara TaxID=1267021 RepID=UPI0023F4579F|nr:hypothetical protein [Frischella perrara]